MNGIFFFGYVERLHSRRFFAVKPCVWAWRKMNGNAMFGDGFFYFFITFKLSIIMNLFNFDTAFEKDLINYHNDITPRIIKLSSKIKFENKMKRQNVENLITELPLNDESLHIVSNGTFDYFTLIPHIISLSQNFVTDFYFSTWTMSRENVIQIIDLFDRGLLKNVNALTGEWAILKKTRWGVRCHIFDRH